MIKLFAIAFALGIVPLASFADPMSVGDGNALAANAPAATINGTSANVVSDTEEGSGGDAMREPLTTPESTAPSKSRQQPDVLRAPRHAPAHAGNAARKKAETTRWQSLLPGVMK